MDDPYATSRSDGILAAVKVLPLRLFLRNFFVFALAVGAFCALCTLNQSPARAQQTPPGESTTPLADLAAAASAQAHSARTLGPPVMETASGPLLGIEQVVAVLGGTLEPMGDGYRLILEDRAFLFGDASPVVVVDQQVVRLSQPPLAGDSGLLVPLDFLDLTFGDTLEYIFERDASDGQVRALRRSDRPIPVTVDMVHLQAVTTVVLEFETKPRYRLIEGGQRVEITLARDRFVERANSASTNDPMVRDVTVAPRKITIDLRPGTRSASYTLENPFRLVLDVVEGEPNVTTPTAPAPRAPRIIGRPQRTEGIRTIVIDPGHGGSETGAIGPSGTVEKDLALSLARALKTRLQQRLPVQAILTRNEDAVLPLETRAAIANQNKADLFFSIHLNSTVGSKAHGAETYFLALEASDSEAARSAEVENSSWEIGESGDDGDPLYDLQLMLWDLAQSHHLAESQVFANLIQSELNTELGLNDRGVKQAPFRVLQGAAMPAVLVELGFMSNPAEERKLQDPAYRADLVDALVRAVTRFRARLLPQPTEDSETIGETSP